MSWIFSRALIQDYENSHFSQAQAAESSADTSLAGEQSAQLSVMPTQHKFWRNDKTMEPSQLSRFGLTCAVLTESRGEALLTWFLEASLVRTYPPLERAQESTGSAPGCGEKWRESSVRYDLGSSSWKIHLSLFPEDLQWSSVTLPKWGMTRSGAVYQHPTLARPIQETGYGLLPTPVRRDYRSPGKSRLERTGSKAGDCLPQVVGGRLMPEWVELIMGWPLGWTDLKPLEMARFHEWRQQHSIF